MLNFNKKDYIKSIETLHPADQADSIEKLPQSIQHNILKTHTKFVYVDEDGTPIPLKEKSIRRIKNLIEALPKE